MSKMEMCGSELIIMAEVTLILSKVSEIMAETNGVTKKEVMKQVVETIKKADKMKEVK